MVDKIQTIKGMHDILPDDIHFWQRLEKTAETVFSAYGYREIRTPVVEKTALFVHAIGEATDIVEKEMYAFEDRGGECLALRPEGTAGVVRAAVQHGLLYGQPQKLWYRGAMFRRERPQRGRTRQFHQLGVEAFGLPGPEVDVELILLGQRLWKSLGIENLRLEVNSLGNAAERAAYRQRLVAYLEQHFNDLDADSQRRLERNPLRILDSKNPKTREILRQAPRLDESLGTESGHYFQCFLDLLEAASVDYILNPYLVRGLDYYSHSVFEWVSDELGAQGTVCAGGRYDGLVAQRAGTDWPGIGFAMGEERLVELLKLSAVAPPAAADIYLVLSGEGSTREGFRLAEELRDARPGLRVQMNLNGGSFKAQFKRADRSGAAWALVLAEDEIQNGRFTVKPLRGQGEQINLPRAELSQWLQAVGPAPG